MAAITLQTKPTTPKTKPDPLEGIDRLLRINEVEQLVGLCRASIYQRIADGTFCKQVSIGGNSVRWKLSDVRAWIDGCTEKQAA